MNTNGATVYYSFLVRVTESGNNIIGDYFIHLGDRLSATSFSFFSSRVFARVDAGGNVNFGFSNTSNPQWIASNYLKNTTYLIIVKYTINTSGNDEVKMWVKSSGVPIDENAAGVADITISDQDGQNVIDAIGFRQVVGIPDLVIDGIRVATSWSNAPLPVEISSFSATTIGSSVKLSWKTETEVNNYGFDVERSLPQPLPKEGASLTPLPLGKGQGDGLWTKIGFVNGNGNSNSPKSYSFEDKNLPAGRQGVTACRYSYRLKQIDNDGKFEYSKTIEVDFGAPKKFELSQNYPNPFNPVTTIRFNLPEASLSSSGGPSQGGTLVKLTVYNILGQQVAVLVNDILESGVHTINFDASNLNSGMYIYKIEAGNFVQARKMTLVK